MHNLNCIVIVSFQSREAAGSLEAMEDDGLVVDEDVSEEDEGDEEEEDEDEEGKASKPKVRISSW